MTKAEQNRLARLQARNDTQALHISRLHQRLAVKHKALLLAERSLRAVRPLADKDSSLAQALDGVREALKN